MEEYDYHKVVEGELRDEQVDELLEDGWFESEEDGVLRHLGDPDDKIRIEYEEETVHILSKGEPTDMVEDAADYLDARNTGFEGESKLPKNPSKLADEDGKISQQDLYDDPENVKEPENVHMKSKFGPDRS